MYWSKLFIPTLRENPAQAESEAHRLLIRAGYLRLHVSGLYHYLFAARRSLLKIEAIVREEMASIGGQEVTLGQVNPITHAIDVIAREIQSYREFPQVWYQMEQRGWLSDDFWVQHSFSIDLSRESLENSYQRHRQAYRRILRRCGVNFADTGSDLMAMSEAGKDSIALAGNYAEKRETAAGVPAPSSVPDPDGDFAPEEFATPGIGTIQDLAAFTGLPETSLIKTLACTWRGQPLMVLLRGDHQLSEEKLRRALDTSYTGWLGPDKMRELLGADAGSLGPVGVKNMPILLDEALRGRRNMIAGANKNGYHLRHVTPGEDFDGRFADVRQATPGEASVTGGNLRFEPAVCLASMRRVPNEDRDPDRLLGHYRLWIEKILIAAADANRDQDGLTLKREIAPFDVVIVPIDCNVAELRSAAEEIYGAAKAAGLDAVLDDRDLRAGAKFKDADLVGIPYRINVGKKLPLGMVEVVARSPKHSADVALSGAVTFVTEDIRR